MGADRGGADRTGHAPAANGPGPGTRHGGELYGVYSLRGEFRTASGEQGTIWPYCYAVTGKYQPGTVDPAKDFLLGSEESFGFEYFDINGGRAWYHLKGADFSEYSRLAANRGVRLLRVGNGIWRAFEWKSVEPERGKFDFRRADYLIDHARKQNCFILGVLGNNLLERFLPHKRHNGRLFHHT